MYRRNLFGCLLALAALAALAAAPGAFAKKSAKKTPAISKVSPMRVQVGETLTIKGRNFKTKARQNTVIFRASNGRSAFVKPRRASRTKLVLTVSERVARLLTVKSSSQQPTRLKLRVLAGKEAWAWRHRSDTIGAQTDWSFRSLERTHRPSPS